MQTKRDSKGRVLRDGERQRGDGRYEYRYTDLSGKQRSVYSWTLVKTDKPPNGKKCGPSLREYEKAISAELEEMIDFYSGTHTTFDAVYNVCFSEKKIRMSTRTLYGYNYGRHVKPAFGDIPISKIGWRQLYGFYANLFDGLNLSASTAKNAHSIISQVFKYAVDEKMIRESPDKKAWNKILDEYDFSYNRKSGLTEEQTGRLLDFIASSQYKKHLPLISFMLGTGCRIGEALALRWEECDFKNDVIHINHTLLYYPNKDGKYEPHIGPPKTKRGKRDIPMLSGVRYALQSEKIRQMKAGISNINVVDGYSGFVFCSHTGNMLCPSSFALTMIHLRDAYTRREEKLAKQEGRDPIYLPKFSAHTFRHTFCTRLCENESNLKVIQDVLGHESIQTTMDIYAEATAKKKAECMQALDGKFRVG